MGLGGRTLIGAVKPFRKGHGSSLTFLFLVLGADRALVAFRESSDELATALVKDAWSANQHVPAILAGTKPAVKSNNGYITMGGPDEATYYVTECGAAWHRTPGAVAWLTKLTTTLMPKRWTRATMH